MISGVQTALSGGNMDEVILSVGIGAASSLIGGKGANYDKAITAPLATIKRETRRANQKYASKVIGAAKKEITQAVGSSGARYVGSQVGQRGSNSWLNSQAKTSGGSSGNKPSSPKKPSPYRSCPGCGRPVGKYGCGGGW